MRFGLAAKQLLLDQSSPGGKIPPGIGRDGDRSGEPDLFGRGGRWRQKLSGAGEPARWISTRLAKDYESYRGVLAAAPEPNPGTTKDWFRWLETETPGLAAVVRRDPFLPSALLPSGYSGAAGLGGAARGLAGICGGDWCTGIGRRCFATVRLLWRGSFG